MPPKTISPKDVKDFAKGKRIKPSGDASGMSFMEINRDLIRRFREGKKKNKEIEEENKRIKKSKKK